MRPEDNRWKVATADKPVTFPFKKVGHSWLHGVEGPTFGQHYDTSPYNWVGLALFKKALEGGPAVRYAGWDGNLGVPADQLLGAIESALGVRPVMIRGGENGNGSCTYSSEDTMLSVQIVEAGRAVSVNIATVNEDVVQKSTALFDRVVIQDNPEAGLVFSLTKNMHGYEIRRLGAAGTTLERGNYNQQVLADYDHVVSDLASESPCGRLTILSGSPGTGKTYLVRSMLGAVKQAAFVVVPPHLIPELGSPEILPALTQAKNEFNGPIVLILEDADKVLVDRGQGDMAAISSMLNLGDGILGAVLDIRILATTNAEKLVMDPATRRRGRLCRYIQVDPLQPAVAASAFQRLTGRASPRYGAPTSLADVYGDARDAGWVAPPIASHRPTAKPYVL